MFTRRPIPPRNRDTDLVSTPSWRARHKETERKRREFALAVEALRESAKISETGVFKDIDSRDKLWPQRGKETSPGVPTFCHMPWLPEGDGRTWGIPIERAIAVMTGEWEDGSNTLENLGISELIQDILSSWEDGPDLTSIIASVWHIIANPKECRPVASIIRLLEDADPDGLLDDLLSHPIALTSAEDIFMLIYDLNRCPHIFGYIQTWRLRFVIRDIQPDDTDAFEMYKKLLNQVPASSRSDGWLTIETATDHGWQKDTSALDTSGIEWILIPLS